MLILDQTALPAAEVWRRLSALEEVEEAIKSLRVRGAPLIGVTAAMAVASLASRALQEEPELARNSLARRVRSWCARLEGTRPTAVNLRWAMDRLRNVALEELTAAEPTADGEGGAGTLEVALRREAARMVGEDRDTCRRIGEHALPLLARSRRILTHCNAGALATAGIGTALAPVYLAHLRGWPVEVLVGETRPLLQGSRLTAWELARAGVQVTVLTDDMAGALFSREPPTIVLVGADRIAANGDVANKIGTYTLAVLAHRHGVPFYVLAPTSTVDLDCASGEGIPIEERSPDEVRRGFGTPTAPAEARVWNPAFDVTPSELVTAIVTECGVARPPYEPALRAAVQEGARSRATQTSAPGDTGDHGNHNA